LSGILDRTKPITHEGGSKLFGVGDYEQERKFVEEVIVSQELMKKLQ
jgi:hypothetical protein